jgi:hypothetical protein
VMMASFGSEWMGSNAPQEMVSVRGTIRDGLVSRHLNQPMGANSSNKEVNGWPESRKRKAVRSGNDSFHSGRPIQSRRRVWTAATGTRLRELPRRAAAARGNGMGRQN